jgi:hypothetical protein
VAVDMPLESIAPSSPLPTTAAGPAAPLPQYAFSFLLLSFSSPHREGLQHFRFFQLAPHTCSYTQVGLLFAGPSIWAQSSPHSCKYCQERLEASKLRGPEPATLLAGSQPAACQPLAASSNQRPVAGGGWLAATGWLRLGGWQQRAPGRRAAGSQAASTHALACYLAA